MLQLLPVQQKIIEALVPETGRTGHIRRSCIDVRSVAIFMFRNSPSFRLTFPDPFCMLSMFILGPDIPLQLEPWHVPLACSFCSIGLNLGKFHIPMVSFSTAPSLGTWSRLASLARIQRSKQKLPVAQTSWPCREANPSQPSHTAEKTRWNSLP